jgi:hypothetical protein
VLVGTQDYIERNGTRDGCTAEVGSRLDLKDSHSSLDENNSQAETNLVPVRRSEDTQLLSI